jgi:hypothetical protein
LGNLTGLPRPFLVTGVLHWIILNHATRSTF